MPSYQSRVTHYIKGENEEEVRKKLIAVGFELQQKVEVISIYQKSNGSVVAWYFHDTKITMPKVEKITKKKVTKKAKKVMKV